MSIYIHIPFCTSICTYCDFCKMFYNKKFIDDYLNALEEEIKERYQGEKVKTIFIGGGTPTCLDYEELKRLLELTNIFNKAKHIEFSIESTTCLIMFQTRKRIIITTINSYHFLFSYAIYFYSFI